MTDKDLSIELQEQIHQALATNTPLCIRGNGTKDWYGGLPLGQELSVTAHRGIINYEPTELVITARCGTPLSEIEATLQAENQLLPFEPPHFGTGATLGGTIACNFSGPARPYSGAARDLVLGCQIINGKGERLSFGGEVMKNVAGYDVSRLMSGSLGTLGVMLDVSLKILPQPEQTLTLAMEMSANQAIDKMCELSALPLPITAACHQAEHLYLRLAGTGGAVAKARKQLAGEVLENGADFWKKLREQELDFFRHGRGYLWRLSVAADTPVMNLEGQWLYDWGGTQRWLYSAQSPEVIRSAAEQAGGHATLFRSNDHQLRQSGQVFHPLSQGLLRYHRRLKTAFDPQGLFNPQRMYSEF